MSGSSSEVQKLTWRQACAWRIRRQYLDQRAGADSMLAVVSRLCGVHAQVMSAAELSLWARVENLERTAVRRALWEERRLIKTWAMRGTLHLLPAKELPLWHSALATSRRYRHPAFWKRCFGITLEELDRMTEAIGTALDGRVMAREELAREVGRLTGSNAFVAGLAQSGWGTILKPAAFRGWLCFASSLGQRVRFTRPDTWASRKPKAVATGVATAEVARRFLGAYGPATYQDLARWWGGGGITMAKQWIAALGEEVSAVELGGRKAWMLAADCRQLCQRHSLRSVRLLPAFDQYVVAASPHAEQLMPGDWRSRIYRPQGWISPVLLINGFMHGIWRHEIRQNRLEVSIEPFLELPSWARRGARREAERLASFLECKLILYWKN
ncbi:MAG: AlkZ family DNA glycosylase [Acidobacteria bacterium]|nr:AlkZ family DNA glycosylase [Acidobacteriota bacterium]